MTQPARRSPVSLVAGVLILAAVAGGWAICARRGETPPGSPWSLLCLAGLGVQQMLLAWPSRILAAGVAVVACAAASFWLASILG